MVRKKCTKQFAKVQQNRVQSRSTSQTLSFRPSCSKSIITIPLDKPTSFPRESDLHSGYIVAAVHLLNNWGQPALLPFPVCTRGAGTCDEPPKNVWVGGYVQ